MKYIPPIGEVADAPYVDGNPATGTEGSAVPAAAIEVPQREIVNVIIGAGLVLDQNDHTQLRQAILSMIVSAQRTIAIDGAFAAGVTSGKIVRWNAGASNFALAVADGTTNDLGIGVADVTNGKVYLYGKVSLFAGLTPGVAYYLDPAIPGAVTSTAPADGIKLGVAKDATTLILDIDPLGVRADQPNAWTKGQAGTPRPAPVTAGTWAPDLVQANNWEVTLTGNIVLANPAVMPVGQSGVIRIVNAGPYTNAYGSFWKPADGVTLPALTAVAGASDDFVYYVESTTRVVVSRIGGAA